MIHPSSVNLPLLVTTDSGDEVETMKDTAILWPWDFFAHLTNAGKFHEWISDDPRTASSRVRDYWTHCEHLEFFDGLHLQPEEYGSTVPLFFHTDGVKIYKNQKAWVYSLSSACRKGSSTTTKFVFVLFRDNMAIKNKTHDSVGHLVGYMVDTMMTGRFPLVDYLGNPFEPGSLDSMRAGRPFAEGWKLAFAGFKGDWEARVVVHKMSRYYRTTYICEHCMASYKDDFTFGDFNAGAASQTLRFNHREFLALNPQNDQSSWTCVKGWTKDRNLEETYPIFSATFVQSFVYTFVRNPPNEPLRT